MLQLVDNFYIRELGTTFLDSESKEIDLKIIEIYHYIFVLNYYEKLKIEINAQILEKMFKYVVFLDQQFVHSTILEILIKILKQKNIDEIIIFNIVIYSIKHYLHSEKNDSNNLLNIIA